MTTTSRIALVAFACFAAGLAVLLPQAGAEPDRSVVLVDKWFKCGDYPQPLDLDLVKVTLTENYDRRFTHAVGLRGKCTGRIGRLEVDTSIGTGVMVGKGAQNLSIEDGYIRCWDRRRAAQRRHDLHQDGVIAMGGLDVTFHGVEIDCRSSNHAAMYFARGRGGAKEPTEGDWPTRVVCDGCTLSARGQLVDIHASIQSGARNSIFACKPHLFKVRATDEAIDPVNENNSLLSKEPCDGSDADEKPKRDKRAKTEARATEATLTQGDRANGDRSARKAERHTDRQLTERKAMRHKGRQLTDRKAAPHKERQLTEQKAERRKARERRRDRHSPRLTRP